MAISRNAGIGRCRIDQCRRYRIRDGKQLVRYRSRWHQHRRGKIFTTALLNCQATNAFFDISGDGGSATGTVNVYGGTLNVFQMYLG